jgi:CRP/FNR family cyclic AMP-dependent transcriptional regulator
VGSICYVCAYRIDQNNAGILTMEEEKQVDLLSRVDIFESLSREEIRDLLDELLKQNAEINLGAGEVFYTPREPDGKLFILIKGRVRIYKMDSSREFTLEVVDAGTVFGEVAFTTHALRDAYAEATEPSILFAMDRDEVERLILQKPKVGLRMVSLLSERLHYYESRMEDVTLKGVPARLASLILFLIESEGVRVPGNIRIPTRYTHEHLGTMIGANREAVTRAFGRLQDEGAVQVRRRIIYVEDVEALERVAGRLLDQEEESLS